MSYLINVYNRIDITEDTTLTGLEDVVVVAVDSTITFPAADSFTSQRAITVRTLPNITATLVTEAGTIEFTSVTSNASRTLHPRAADNAWRQI